MMLPEYEVGELCVVRRGTTITKDQTRIGSIPVVAGGVTPTYFHDTANRPGKVVTISASGASAGFVGYWEQPIFASDCSTVESVREDVCIEYVFRALQAKQSFINSKLRSGAAQPHVYAKDIARIRIPLPPLDRQRHLARLLQNADLVRTKRREAIAQTDRLAHAIFLDVFGDPVSNPKDFPRRKLGELIKFEGGAQPPASTFSYSDGPDKIRLVQIRDFKSDRFTTYIPRSLAKRFFNADDVMVGRYGPPVFQIFRGLAGSYNVALMKATPRDGVTREFVFWLLKEARLQRFVIANSERTAGQSGVNLDLLENYDAYLPPMSLQEHFCSQMRALSTLQERMSASLQDCEDIFASIQHQALHKNR